METGFFSYYGCKTILPTLSGVNNHCIIRTDSVGQAFRKNTGRTDLFFFLVTTPSTKMPGALAGKTQRLEVTKRLGAEII